MADTTAAPVQDGADKPRAQKPDEAKFKADIAKAEKEHEGAQARFVCSPPPFPGLLLT